MSRSSNMARLGILILALITTVAPIAIALTHVENACAKEAVLHLIRDDLPDGAKCKSIIDLGCVCSESTGDAFLRSLGDYVKDGRGECREQYFAEIQASACAYCLFNDLVPPESCRKASVRIVPAESNVQ
ncbi:BZ3500_MvSof-1268-A1-R1_Chr1-1g01179 [Microbotryum saponariae]|uniref:BZ3500_MvSof-1268-A1-R1_Chr1-1g01179 protein n=1 Tax=Microbotryum saponariae TaxID=289078 RepID=A0A2X0K9P1_9BASI|nr:BZ3500_MvSof-1268-A1-R1_Chr1-1g01179 [Microbotryum saponariae]SCZ93588.1 BZ3501_MvSof-1269-A2-R1_Chr1-1g00775 [Microbotryum saponariae]